MALQIIKPKYSYLIIGIHFLKVHGSASDFPSLSYLQEASATVGLADSLKRWIYSSLSDECTIFAYEGENLESCGKE